MPVIAIGIYRLIKDGLGFLNDAQLYHTASGNNYTGSRNILKKTNGSCNHVGG